MSDYIATSADLTSVANAIRTKGGTSEQLAFPSGFVQAIGDIGGGGGAQIGHTQYVTTADAKTTGAGGNTSAFYNRYMSPNIGNKSDIVCFVLVTNNTATGNYARAAFYWKTPDMVGSNKTVYGFFRTSNPANSTASNIATSYDYFTSAGSVIDVWTIEGSELPT